MLRSLNQLIGYSVLATDGPIGRVSEMYFDDQEWRMRYLVVETGGWLSSRKVLLPVLSLEKPDWKLEEIPVSLTRELVRSSPEIDTDMPVARQHEIDLHAHYGWEMYWAGGNYMRSGDMVPYVEPEPRHIDTNKGGKPYNPHLRSTKFITSCRVHAIDGDVGHASDFIIDDAAWMIHQLVINIGTFFSPNQVMLPPERVGNIEWERRKVNVKVYRDDVRNSPQFTLPTLLDTVYEDAVF